MNSSPARLGGLLPSKPTWSNHLRCSTTSAFFSYADRGKDTTAGTIIMKKPASTMAQQIAHAATAFEQQRTGHTPQSVTVVLSEETLVITMHGALSPAERVLAGSLEGAAQVQ